jgi:nucleoside-diphosphate-sugar epimerase
MSNRDVSRVLVTGANGYISMWIMRYLLDEGYFVRGTVRNEAKIASVTDYFPEHSANGRLEIVVVGEHEGSF